MIINQNHPEIIESKSGKNNSYATVKETGIYFTNAAAKKYKLIAGKYLHFMNEKTQWRFFQNDDPDGFLLQADSKKNCEAVFISNKALAMMFKKAVRQKKISARYSLMQTTARQNGSPVIEILTYKTYDELMRQL